MALRGIDFPDHNDPSFNEDEPFEAPNGVTYTWNGYGWEVSCGFGDPECELDVETELLAYAANTDLAEGQAFVYSSGFFWKGDQTGFIEDGQEFKVGDDTFTVTNIEVIEDATYGEFTKVDTAEDPTGLIGQTLEVEGFCAPIGKRYLLAHGDNVTDADSIVKYQWNQDVEVTLKDDNYWTFKNSGDFVQLEGLDDDNISLNAELANVDIHSSSVQVVAVNQAKLTSESSDVTLEGASDQAEKVNRTIDASSPDEQIANKRYVDETAAFLQGEVVELEQEIEGIAITSERGEWISATSVNAGEFRMVNLGGQNTQDYNDETVVSIIFNNFDAQDPSVEHGWADVEIGNILELLDKPDSDYAIYEITGINPGGGTMGFDVAFIKGVGEATLGDRARIKIFAKPTGGNLEDYVRIGGDTMTGALTIDVAQPQNNPANSFRIWGMIKPDAASPPERSLLLKDFRREQGSDSDDYIAYYGSGGGDSGLVNLGMLSEYLKKVDLGISRTTTAVTVTNTAGTNAQINGATTSVAGVVTTSEQTWSGQKHFNGVVDFKNKIKVNGSTTNNRYLGTDGSGNTTWKTVSTASNYVRTETADYNASIKIYRSGSSYYITGGAS